jgi:methylthioribose-1-phosphate isomerase
MSEQHPYLSVRTVWWEEVGEDDTGNHAQSQQTHGYVCLLDQSALPHDVHVLHLFHEQQVADAIITLKVRGAPVIGVTAAFGLALGLVRWHWEHEQHGEPLILTDAWEHFQAVSTLLSQTRPTAVNLFWALGRMRKCAEKMVAASVAVAQFVAALLAEAQAIAAEDVQACLQMGMYGATLIADGATLLTHCNAGALATAGIGTALAPVYTAARAGKRLHVYVDETRPVLQGARLTAWELQQEGIPLTLITDNMAGYFMQQGAIQAIFVGADRIAANGDVANKIGTYSLAVLAHVHHIPLYVVAPCSTVDLHLSSGEAIPIEQRRPDEVTTVLGTSIAPANVAVANPAFDITPHVYVSAIVTEKGIARFPYSEALAHMCAERNNDTSGKVYGK